jgi:hypothetical protein
VLPSLSLLVPSGQIVFDHSAPKRLAPLRLAFWRYQGQAESRCSQSWHVPSL